MNQRVSSRPGASRAVVAAALAAALASPLAAAAQSGGRLAPVFAGKVELQRDLASLMEDRLRVVSRPFDLYVAVQLEMRGEIRQSEKGGEPGTEMKIGSQQTMKLPGLPTIDRNLTGAGAPNISVKIPGRKGEVTRSIEAEIERMDVKVLVDPAMPKDLRDRVRTLAVGLAGIDPSRGDTLELQDLPAVQARGDGISPSGGGIPGWFLVACATALLSCVILAAGMVYGRRAGQAGDVNVQLGREGREEDADVAAAQAAAEAGVAAPQAAPLTAEERAQRGFLFLDGASPDELVELLQTMDAELAAVVIDRVGLPPEVASRVFATLDNGKRLKLSLALGKARVLPREYLAQVETRVQWELEQVRSRVKLGGEKALVEMLAHMPAAAQQELLEELTRTDPALAQAVRGKLLLFEDLAALPASAVRQIVTAVNPAVAATALKDAPEALRNAVLGSVSKRLRAIIEAEGEGAAASAAGEVETARKNVETVMRRLQANGELRSRADS